MSLHNLSGVQLLEPFGYTRAVLAREMNAEEIAQVCRGTTMEIEMCIRDSSKRSRSTAAIPSYKFAHTIGNTIKKAAKAPNAQDLIQTRARMIKDATGVDLITCRACLLYTSI